MHRNTVLATIALAGALVSLSGCKDAEEVSEEKSPVTTPTDQYVNWETPHGHPIDVTPSGSLLLAVNTPDARLEVFDPGVSTPTLLSSIPVGLDPVTVRARTDAEAWVVNHISDSVSVVDLSSGQVTATIRTLDEPMDVVFAGIPERAFVSCSQANTVQVFDPGTLAEVGRIPIQGEDPRSLAVSADGSRVYVGIFESGNGTTILSSSIRPVDDPFPPQYAMDDPGSPYGGQNPPPNDCSTTHPPGTPPSRANPCTTGVFDPPMNLANGAPPDVALIVRRTVTATGIEWVDDNGADWSFYVSGSDETTYGRVPGWDMPDHDVAIIDANTGQVLGHADGMLSTVMAVAVRPGGDVTAVGIDATNHIRFEPVLNGTFLRVNVGLFDPTQPGTEQVVDLNPRLDYSTPNVAPAIRNQSLGDPRAIAWNAGGTRGYVAGMGSNNVVPIDATGARVDPVADPISVGDGPSGLAFLGNRLFVLNRFSASITTIDTTTDGVLGDVTFHDPTPLVIRTGRRFLYDTHATSGLGHAACGSCHVDGKHDRLAWDLGAPDGTSKPSEPADDPDSYNLNFGFGFGQPQNFPDFHPMKGPMVTQTLQAIIGMEPLHWRGDKYGLEEFNGAFTGLQGADAQLTVDEMADFKAFVATIHLPPNPFRNLDNTLSTSVDLGGRISPVSGLPLPNGDAQRGRDLYALDTGNGSRTCRTCHTLPTGSSADVWVTPDSGGLLVPTPPLDYVFPPDDQGNVPVPVLNANRQSLFGTNRTALDQIIKAPQLRNLYEREGFDATVPESAAGFGFFHDGTMDSLTRFVSGFRPQGPDQDIADLLAFLLSMSGSGFDDLPTSDNPFDFTPAGPASLDTHAGVGFQVTVTPNNIGDPNVTGAVAAMIREASTNNVGLIAKAGARGAYLESGAGANAQFVTDAAADPPQSTAQLVQLLGLPMTFTVVPFDTQIRAGVDRDRDGCLDADDAAPTDPTSC